jgi:hypothetical protein
MRKTFFCGVDLHSNNAMYIVTDQEDKPVLKKRLIPSFSGTREKTSRVILTRTGSTVTSGLSPSNPISHALPVHPRDGSEFLLTWNWPEVYNGSD